MDMIGYVEYAKVFDNEGGIGDLDRGNPESTEKWLRDLAKSPMAKVNFYPVDEAALDELKASPNFQEEVMGYPRIKQGNPDLGTGQYVQLKVKLKDEKEIFDKKTKTEKVIDFGGVPKVLMMVDGDSETGEVNEWKDYDPEELGGIGNGSKVKMRFDEKYMRPKVIGVLELVEYTSEGGSQEESF